MHSGMFMPHCEQAHWKVTKSAKALLLPCLVWRIHMSKRTAEAVKQIKGQKTMVHWLIEYITTYSICHLISAKMSKTYKMKKPGCLMAKLVSL